jgi:hypothetical protein
LPHHDQAKSRMTHPTFCMQVLGYFVNVRDQSFLATVFKNILQGRWSIKQANVACRNKAMHTKLETAVQFNLEEHTRMSGKDLPTCVPLVPVKDLVEEICGWTKTFPTDLSMCTLNDEMFQVNQKFANNVSEKKVKQAHSAALVNSTYYSGKLTKAKKKVDR